MATIFDLSENTAPDGTDRLYITDGTNDEGVQIANLLKGSGAEVPAAKITGTVAHEQGGLEADVSAYDGLIRIAGGSTSNLKSNFSASAAPTTGDDSGDGYVVGSRWIDTTNDAEYICVDNTAAAAVWVQAAGVNLAITGTLTAGATTVTGDLKASGAGVFGSPSLDPSAYSSDASNLIVYESGNAGITIVTGTADKGSLYFSDGTTGTQTSRGRVQYDHNTDTLSLAASATTFLSGTSAGVVVSGTLTVSSYLQGTTTNGYLDLRGDSGATNYVRIADTGNVTVQGGALTIAHTAGSTGLTINGGGTNSALVMVGNGGNQYLTIGEGDATDAGHLQLKASGSTVIQLDAEAGQPSYINNGGKLLVGDTANANMTVGLTINQGANDNEILALKSSDVAHGLVGVTETDTFGLVGKLSSTRGGMWLRSVATDDAGLAQAFLLSVYGGTASATKSTSGIGLINLYASEHDGAGTQSNIAADGNILSVRARVGGADLTRWILDEDGDTWQTGSLTTGAPSGGTAAPWKLGTVAAVSPTSPDRTIEVDINGTTYYLHAKTTND